MFNGMKAVLWAAFLHFQLLAGVCFQDPTPGDLIIGE
jgi:hypothetical protein